MRLRGRALDTSVVLPFNFGACGVTDALVSETAVFLLTGLKPDTSTSGLSYATSFQK